MDEAYEFQKAVYRGEIELPLTQGGPGSGDHGHSGRPGKVGGSSGGKAMRRIGGVALSPGYTEPKPKLDKIQDCETEIRETLRGFSSFYGPGDRPTKRDAQAANLIRDEVKSIGERFPEFKYMAMDCWLKDRQLVTAVNLSDHFDRGVSGVYGPGSLLKMNTNPKLGGAPFSTPNEKGVSFGKYSTTSDFAGTFRHELGHAVQTQTPRRNTKEWNRTLKEAAGSDSARWNPKTREWVRKNISEYGSTSSSEAFAESFSAYTHPAYKSSKNKLPKPVEDYFKNLLGA
jgi:hypothetical protein